MRKTKKPVKAKRALCALTAGILATGMVMPVFAQDEVITPQSADYGYYVDNYKKNGASGVKDTLITRLMVCFQKCLSILLQEHRGIMEQFLIKQFTK